MEKVPQFIRKFSKEKFPQERKDVAEKIMAERTKRFAEEKYLVEQKQRIETLQKEISRLSVSKTEKALNYFQIKKIQKELADRKEDIQSKAEGQTDVQELKMILMDFYEDQKREWADSEYSKEDIVENFSEEHLAALSIEEYALLLRRFPCEMASHVTRQGVRDHVGNMGIGGHTEGEGAYFNNFMKLAEDGRLRSPLGVYFVEAQKEKAVASFLQLDRFKEKKDAIEYLDKFTSQDILPGSYMDKTAIHFATEGVADCYYGAEKENEIFISFPAAHIASQYYFNGYLNEVNWGEWNDKKVWLAETEGMDLSAAIIFIPKQAKVDPNTGSRYALDSQMNPVRNEKDFLSLRRMLESSDFDNFALKTLEKTGKLKHGLESAVLNDANLQAEIESIRQEMKDRFGVGNKKLQDVLLDFHVLKDAKFSKERMQKQNPQADKQLDDLAENILKKAGAMFVEASSTITSKDFWENYFSQNPPKRPLKIVYYEGTDPTQALYRWRRENCIGKKAKDEYIGFEENHVGWNSTKARGGVERFRSIAEKVIDKHFS